MHSFTSGIRRGHATGAVALAGLAALSLAACNPARPVDQDPGAACSQCHGSKDSPAPPRDLLGSDDPVHRGVGAHQAHLTSRRLSVPLTCDACHQVPTTANASGHMDDAWPAEVRLRGLAASHGLDPGVRVPQGSGEARKDRDLEVTCSAVYCHGATLSGGDSTTPAWNRPSSRWTACGACHGFPPPAPHVPSTQCAACHGDTVGADNTIAHPERHINGVVEYRVDCASCHGDPGRGATTTNPRLAAAPPRGTRGETEPTQRAVGAHQVHLTGGTLARGMACGTCHAVPTSNLHANGQVGVTLGGLATTGGARPAWDGATCSATYCHGNFRNGAHDAPTWTSQHQSGCGSCHALPPGGTHPRNGQCGSCHPGYGSGTVDLDRHVNGVVDLAGMTCSSCHGDASRAATALNPALPAAPPVGSRGERNTSDRAVGAHQAHLRDGALRGAMACTECHVVPTRNNHADGTANLAFGPLARAGGAAPVWDGTGCAATYCHGAFPGGTLGNAPRWTGAGQAACGSCHGTPPPAPHPASTQCGTCHTGYTATTVNATDHVNGRVDVVNLSCASCHGDGARSPTQANPLLPAAPPTGTGGETLVTQRAVGAHQAHLTGGRLGPVTPCTACHQPPAAMDHANGAVDLAFSGLATQGGVTPVWDGTGCAATYCHGNFQNGATGNTPSWTAVGGAACGSCHGLPPGGSHPSNPACGSCHPGYTSAQVNLSLHLNGAFDVITLTCASCHGDGARSPTQANPLLPAAPPTGTRGETLVTQRAVGAHQAHLTGGRLGPVTPCTACHQPPAAMDHANGAVELAFSGLATQGGVTPVWDGTGCAATYCHGNFQNGATGNTPSWTGAGGAACGSCHGLPPGGSHPNNPACGSCHPGYTSAQVNLSLHLNGAFDVITLTCASCHGDGARSPTQANPLLPAAPPTGTRGETLVTQRAVGAHQAHLTGGRLGLVTPCTACHQPPAAMDHANGAVELAFSGLATQGGVTPVWDGTGCAATYCHGNFQNGATGNTPSWTGAGGAACGSCHGLPPGGSHPSNPACGSCHPGYTSAQVNLSLHLNGAFDVTTLTCASCHGDGARSPTHVNPLLPAAPPTGTRGETLVTQRAVGAHQAHLTVGRLGFVTPCTACHQPPTAMDHANGAVELAFSGLATQGGVTPVWDGTGCAATYCHGNFPGGTRGNTPAWTGTNQGACGTCHGLAPATGQHWTHAGEECSGCHGTGYVGREATTSVNAAIHLDGALQVGGPGSLISTFSRVSRTCASDCHDVQTW